MLGSTISQAEEIKGIFTKSGDSTHLEFTGKKTWNYNLRRDGNKIILNISEMDAQTKAHFSAWKDSLVQGVSIADGPDGGEEITFLIPNQVESFDYLTDQPSRLIIDFFKGDRKAVGKGDANVSTKAAQKTTRLPQKKGTRQPAAVVSKEETGVPAAKPTGVYDAADPDYSRFNVLNIDIVENAVIASRNNIYLSFPIYDYPTPVLKEMLEARPEYEIKPEDTDENKKARLLLTLFNKKRPAVFLKTLEFFEKQYPESKYREIVSYMESDIYFGFYEESKNPLDLERATMRYLAAADKFPTSVLSERTTLFVGYTYFDRGDYINAMKVFNRFEKRFPQSQWLNQVRISLADSHKALNHPDDALKVLESIENDESAGEFRTVAAFKKGDVYFGAKEYGKAITEYKKYLQKYGNERVKFPNVHFNMAESYFWLGQYKMAIDSHREFLRLFPRDNYGGYAITRVGELLEIMGAPRQNVDGAFLESIFRYQGSEGANVARTRLTSDRMGVMKEKELKIALEEVNKFSENSKLPRAKEFATILVSDGYCKRLDYKKSLDLLIDFYKRNPTSDLQIFKNRIRDNIIHQLRTQVTKNQFMEAFKIYGEYVSVWLKNNDRIDIEYYLARSFEIAGVQSEAASYYRKVLNRLYAIEGTSEEKERRVLEDLPSTESVNLRLAALTVAQRDYGKAFFYLDSIKVIGHLTPEEQIERTELASIVAEERGHPELAKKFLKTLIESWKGQPALVSGPYLRLAELQIKSKEYNDAITNLEKVLHLDTDSKQVPAESVARAMELKGDMLAETKNYKEAIGTYRKLLDKFEDSQPLESVRYQLGKLQFEVGSHTDAEKTWSALKPESFWAKLAKEQLENGRWNQQYKKYIKRIPAFADAKKGK
jgi:tetratricopeptide (TPR) repeat protein